MKFGLFMIETADGVEPKGAPLSSPDYLRAMATHAEEVGFDSLWFPDHVAIAADYESRYPYQEYEGDEFKPYPWVHTPFPEPITALTYCAAVTERILLRTAVVILPQRNPVVFAKQLATADQLSGGRIGLGWQREQCEGIGVPWKNRGKRAEEYIEAMRALWTEDEASYHGDTVDFDRLICLPKPAQEGGVPIHVGGHSEAAARRAGRLGDGFLPIIGSGDSTGDETSRLVGVMRDAAEEAGRDPAKIEVSGFGSENPDENKALEEAGFEHLFLFLTEPDIDAGRARLDQLARDVIEPHKA